MQDTRKQELKGSESRDQFKYLHKKLDKKFYACDIDFVLVDKYPFRIVAFLDYKGRFEKVTFSEVIAYNYLLTIAPLYIIRSRDVETGPFDIWSYLGGDPQPEPPVIKDELVRQCESWNDLGEWEHELRLNSRRPHYA